MSNSKHDTKIIKAFIEGTVHTLNVQCSVVAQVGKPYPEKKDELTSSADIISLINLDCKNFQGTAALCFNTPVFLGILSSMLGQEYKEINSDVEDGANELLNIIFGFAKRELNNHGYELKMAIPVMLKASEAEEKGKGEHCPVIVPFTSKVGDFFVRIAVK